MKLRVLQHIDCNVFTNILYFFQDVVAKCIFLSLGTNTFKGEQMRYYYLPLSVTNCNYNYFASTDIVIAITITSESNELVTI